MPAEFPNITDLRNRRTIECKTGQVVGRIGCRGRGLAVEQEIDLAS